MLFATTDGLRIHYEVEGSGGPLMLYDARSGERSQDTGKASDRYGGAVPTVAPPPEPSSAAAA